MATHILQFKGDVDQVVKVLQRQKLPCTVVIKKGKPRTNEQNRTMWMWLREYRDQRPDDRVGQVRAGWKLDYGIPILCRDDELFRQSWEIVEGEGRQTKLDFVERTDFPVTRLMTTKQFKEFHDDLYNAVTESGIALTHPDGDYE